MFPYLRLPLLFFPLGLPFFRLPTSQVPGLAQHVKHRQVLIQAV